VNRQSLREYNAAIDAWIEREARLSPSPFETVKASEMPFLLSVVRMVSQGVRREAMQKAAGGSSDLADKVSTPLGNAAPLEYSERTAGNDAFSMAARGVSEAQEAGAFASMRLTCSDALAVQMGGARMATSCRQNAFDRYRQCRGY
jgi:hypothetical protein